MNISANTDAIQKSLTERAKDFETKSMSFKNKIIWRV